MCLSVVIKPWPRAACKNSSIFAHLYLCKWQINFQFSLSFWVMGHLAKSRNQWRYSCMWNWLFQQLNNTNKMTGSVKETQTIITQRENKGYCLFPVRSGLFGDVILSSPRLREYLIFLPSTGLFSVKVVLCWRTCNRLSGDTALHVIGTFCDLGL